MRTVAATNTLSHEADIAQVLEWLGHVNMSTIRLYSRRTTQWETSQRSECVTKTRGVPTIRLPSFSIDTCYFALSNQEELPLCSLTKSE